MAVMVVCLVLFLAMTGHSSASYCVCKDGVGDSILQKNIDYACGAGADCSSILQTGNCYNPNTVKDHCNYAVNSYYQKKQQATGSCDFSGTANVVSTFASPNTACIYPASSSATTGTNGTSTTPSTGGGTTTPSTTGGTTTPSTGGSTTTTTTPTFGGLGPTGSGSITNTDSKATLTLHQNKHLLLFWSFTLTLLLLFSGPTTTPLWRL